MSILIKYKIIIAALALLFLGGCIPTKEQRAKRKLAKHWNKVEDIIREYPELSDSVFSVEHDTIYIESKSDSIVYELGLDSMIVDSVLAEYVRAYQELKALEAEEAEILESMSFSPEPDLITISESDNARDRRLIAMAQDREEQMNDRLMSISRDRDRLMDQLNGSRNALKEKVYSDQEFNYQDSNLTALIKIVDGNLSFNYSTKEQKHSFEKYKTSVTLDSGKSKGFWSYVMSWVFLIIILVLAILLFRSKGK